MQAENPQALAEAFTTIEELQKALGLPSYDAAKKHVARRGYEAVADPADARAVRYRVDHLNEKDGQALAVHRALEPLQKKDTPGPVQPWLSAEWGQEEPDTRAPAVPAELLEYERAMRAVVADCVDGNYINHKGKVIEGFLVKDPGSYMRARAAQSPFRFGTVRRWVRLKRRIERDKKIVGTAAKYREFVQRALPKKRPGRSGHAWHDATDEGTIWAKAELESLFLNLARFSVRQITATYNLKANAKRTAFRGKRHYPKLTERMVRGYLKTLPRAQVVLAREGQKAYSDKCAPYISRRPDSIHAGEILVTDQRLSDVRVRGDGEQLGRIWQVALQCVRSGKILGFWFGPILSSDMVISASAMAIGRNGVPKAILMDLGKEFQCTAFHGSFRKIKGETLFRETQGMCQRLGIEVIDAIGDNAQAKPIERWHRSLAEFDRNIPGWCGSNTDERPEVLAEFERQHEDWKKGRRASTPLWTIRQYIRALVNWIENDWNAQHRGRGKYLRGMTPNECWNTHLPPEGVRRVTPTELELATADHRVLKVARGGQVNIALYGTTLEYVHPELFLRQGQELEVIVSRRTLRKVTVLDSARNGRFLCEATAKPLFHWGLKTPEDREELRQAIRMRNAARKAISLGNAARRVLEVTATPPEIDPQRPLREISSTEFRSRKMRQLRAPKTLTAGDLAREVFGEEGV